LPSGLSGILRRDLGLPDRGSSAPGCDLL